MALLGSKNQRNEILVEGLKAGMVAFIICFTFSFILSVIINLTVLDFFTDMLVGSLSEVQGMLFGNMIRITGIILGFSLFNTTGSIHIGLLMFSLIPFVAFIVASRKHLKKGLTPHSLYVSCVTSLGFTIIYILFAWITKGKYIELNVNFLSFSNAGITFLATLFIQVVIGINYNKDVSSYIKATRMMLRILMGVGAVWGLITLIRLFATTAAIGLLPKIIGIIFLLPNFMVYKANQLMGNNIILNENTEKWFNSINISFDTLSVGFQTVGIVIWLAIVVISLLVIDHKKYWMEMSIFAAVFSALSLFLAYCVSSDSGNGKVVYGNINFGLNLLLAFLIPFVSILAVGSLLWLVKKMIAIIKEV